ncbi:MAG: AAA family ATPase [Desulfobaccales bacterium]
MTQDDKVSGFKPLAAEDLMTKEFQPPRWVIPNLVPDGLTLLCGPPKIGKSWMALDWAIAVVTGGHALGRLSVEQGEVLYLALEDSDRRMQKRLGKLLSDGASPKGLYIRTRTGGFPLLEQGGRTLLDDWLRVNPKVKLVIIDTLARARAPQKGGQNVYDADVKGLTLLQDLAFKHNLALVVVHHIRKQKADDILATVSGSYGIAGTADSIAILTRSGRGKDAILTITGRDIEDQELDLKFSGGKWELLDLEDSKEAKLSPERQAIIDTIKENGPMTPGQVAEKLKKNNSTIKTTLRRMADGGVLMAENGTYSLSPPPPPDDEL